MKFAYQAYSRSGSPVQDVIEAASQAEAMELLRDKGLFVGEVREEGPGRATIARSRSRGGGRLRNLASFARQLHVLVSSGTPLVQALGAIERQTTSPAWKGHIAELRGKVEEGIGLSEAMAQRSDLFDPVWRSLIAAGESSGDMARMLERLCALSRKQAQLRSALLGAMIYPAMLMALGVCVFFGMLVFVLPRFVGLFQTLDVKLPPTTQFLIALSDALRTRWWAFLGGGLLAGGAAWRAARSGWGKRAMQSLVLATPRLSEAARGVILGRICRVLGVLLDAHVPLLDSLRLAGDAAGNWRYAELIARAQDVVSRGQTVSEALGGSELISPSLREAIRSGEQSGRLGPLLLQMADILDEENEVVVKALTSIVEPLILVVLGVLVGFIAISLFMPLFDLAGAAQGGAG